MTRGRGVRFQLALVKKNGYAAEEEVEDADDVEDALWLAIDQGTTSTRAILFGATGQIVQSARRSVAIQCLSGGHVEQDATEIATSVDKVIDEVVASVDDPTRIRGAALATQRSSVVAWDRITGAALSPVLSWQDTRMRRELNAMRHLADEIQQRTGLPLTPHYGASKIAWLLHSEPIDPARDDQPRYPIVEAHRAGRLAIGPLAAFLIQSIVEPPPSGLRSSRVDHANAGRTQLMNLTLRDWDPWLLKQFNVPDDILPEIVPTEFDFGRLRSVPTHLLVAQGDQSAAIYGQGGLDTRLAHVNLGTGGFVLRMTAQVERQTPLLRSIARSCNAERPSRRPAVEYILEGTINGCGAALAWAADQRGLTVNAANIDRWLQAALSDTGTEIDNVPLFLNTVGGLGSPYWKSGPTANWVDEDGNPRAVEDALAMLAVLESILFLVAANLRALQDTGDGIALEPLRGLRITGGLSASDAYCQRLADVTDLPVTRPDVVEATARGAAWLASGRSPRWTTSGSAGAETTWHPRENPRLRARCERLWELLGTVGNGG